MASTERERNFEEGGGTRGEQLKRRNSVYDAAVSFVLRLSEGNLPRVTDHVSQPECFAHLSTANGGVPRETFAGQTEPGGGTLERGPHRNERVRACRDKFLFASRVNRTGSPL